VMMKEKGVLCLFIERLPVVYIDYLIAPYIEARGRLRERERSVLVCLSLGELMHNVGG